MIITILSEPRSGSTNLLIWMRVALRNDFIVLGEPCNHESPDFKANLYDFSWVDLTKNYVINEKFYMGYDISQLISISDKIVCLYREDEISQIESYIMADVTKNWAEEYQAEKYILNKIDTTYIGKKNYFQSLKKVFKEFRELHNFKTFSYEELYYGNKINEFKDYLGLTINIPFPYGKKYRHDIKIKRLV